MTAPLRPHNQPGPGTYVFQPRKNQEELEGEFLQSQAITKGMGGTLPEQVNPANFQKVLDIACGSGGWVIDAARAYPHMSLVGIDINIHTIEFAREQSLKYHLEDRVEFHMMDALRVLEFPDDTFDLVNLRFAIGFLRTWDWPRLLHQVMRILKPQGILRLTDGDVIHQSNSPATTRFCEALQCALFRSGHLFAQENDGLTAHMAPLLAQHGYEQVETKACPLKYRNGTPPGESYKQITGGMMRALRPFLQKWGCLNEDFDVMYQHIVEEMSQPEFHSTWRLLTVWGAKPLLSELASLV
ncbi:MAG TPA: methyltransferase domain-containing protein [Ktedonobacteraceae bacterium]|nr:methyltransferase domain-containing protein [Ktedonobacteraceae bacterium]